MLRLLALLLWLALPALAGEAVVTGVSTDKIALNANFDGSELFVFGAVRRDAPIPTDAGPLDVIITIKGPPRQVTVRRKSRVLGIWVNTASLKVRQAPSFYAIASTRPVGDLLDETDRLRYGIGMDEAVRRVAGSDTIEDTTPFTEAVIRLRMANGTYAELDHGVILAEDTLFQTRIEMPANLVEGDYAAQFFLVRDGKILSAAETTILVEKTGIERWIYNLSKQQPLAYGILAVLVAFAAGWIAAEAFRLARR
ncbi:MAG: TIGR02186 family protein [Amaricoccus sp.]|uniref:TIGR02186 family protein n=1 Tax=Amaricoccus sp. TaxID=1872485 RepID=UPI0039E3963B